MFAAVTAFIPGGCLASVTDAFLGGQETQIANDFDYYNRWNGVTLKYPLVAVCLLRNNNKPVRALNAHLENYE